MKASLSCQKTDSPFFTRRTKKSEKAFIPARSPGQLHEFERIRGLIDPESKTSKSAPLLKVWSDNINQVVIPSAVEGSIEIVPKAIVFGSIFALCNNY
jgi:hypothetical protein